MQPWMAVRALSMSTRGTECSYSFDMPSAVTIVEGITLLDNFERRATKVNLETRRFLNMSTFRSAGPLDSPSLNSILSSSLG